MKITKAIAKGILLGAVLIAIASLSGCGVPATGPNPLDPPGTVPPTVRELHAANISNITGNPARTLW